jgi:hypothetical protein
MFNETPNQIAEHSDIPKLTPPNFSCNIPETALGKLTPEIAEIMKMNDINVQYSKWQCETLCQINDYLRKNSGKTVLIEEKLSEIYGDHKKVSKMYRSYEMVCDWKSLLIVVGGVIGGLWAIVDSVYPYVIK